MQINFRSLFDRTPSFRFNYYSSKMFLWKSRIKFSCQNIRDTEKIVYFKNIYNFGLKILMEFFTGIVIYTINNVIPRKLVNIN